MTLVTEEFESGTGRRGERNGRRTSRFGATASTGRRLGRLPWLPTRSGGTTSARIRSGSGSPGSGGPCAPDRYRQYFRDERNDQMKVTFTVDGRMLQADISELTVSEILSLAGASKEKSFLLLKDVEYRNPNERIRIHDSDEFLTKPRDLRTPPQARITYTINGETQTTLVATLTVKEILERAGQAASIDAKKIDSYYVEDLENGRKYSKLDDNITINDGDQFLAIYSGPTPVA